MSQRLIEPVERWLLDVPLLALAAALAWRLGAGLLLWGAPFKLWPLPGQIDSQVLAAAALASLLLLAACLLPREYSAIAGLLLGGGACLLALGILPRHGWLLDWPMGSLHRNWWIAAAVLLAVAWATHTIQQLRWKQQIRGHGIEWTRQWAGSRPYTARKLALRALRYMGDDESA